MRSLLSSVLMAGSLAIPVSAVSLPGTAAAETIGVTLANTDFDFVKVLENAYKSRDDVTIVLKNAAGDGDLQTQQIHDFVAAGVDAIIVNPIQPDNGIEISLAAGQTPLIYVNQEPINSAMFPATQGYVGSDETESGTLQMTEICRQLGGRGSIAVLMGNLETGAARTRTEAVYSVLDKPECSGITIAREGEGKWETGLAQEIVSGWLSDGLKVDAIVANNDSMALGALQALKDAGVDKSTVLLAGIDGTQDTLKAMAAGEIDVTVFQNAVGQANGSVDLAKKFVAGDMSTQFLSIPFELVVPANRADYVN